MKLDFNLHFLFGIANSDGNISNSELLKLKQIGDNLGINLLDLESIKATFVEDTDNAYKILKIKPGAFKRNQTSLQDNGQEISSG